MPTGVYERTHGDALKARLESIRVMQAEPFTRKVERAQQMISDLAAKGQIAVMFSGGRDSYAVARLAQPHAPWLVYCDTGLSSPTAAERVRQLAGTLNCQLAILTPETPALQMWRRKGHYPIGPKRGHTFWKQATPGLKTSPVACCYHLKEKPARQYICDSRVFAMLWGNRAADSNRRKFSVADFGMLQEPSQRWPCWSAQPLALWLDSDIEQLLGEENTLFEARSEDGCVLCCTDISRRDNQLTKTFIRNRPLFDEAILGGLGEQILIARGEADDIDNVPEILRDQPHRFLRVPK